MRIFRVSILLIPLLFWFSVSFAATCNEAERLSRQGFDLRQTDPASAIRLARDAIALCPESAAIVYNLGLIHYENGRHREAVADFEKALQLRPDFAPAYNALANLWLGPTGENVPLARHYARLASRLAPRDRNLQDTLLAAEGADIHVDIPPVTDLRNRAGLAVVIGVRSYFDKDIPAVDYAGKDAKAVRDYLEQSLGYAPGNIIFRENPTLTELLSLFGKPGSAAKGELYNRTRRGVSEIVIYYSGHGAPDPETREAYLLPSDAAYGRYALTGYSLADLRTSLEELRRDMEPRSITVLLDACFSGTTQVGPLIGNASGIGLRPILPAGDARNMAFLTSSKTSQISSWDKGNDHGIFTYHLLETLKERLAVGQQVTIADLRQRLIDDERVLQSARRLHNRRQDPQFSGDTAIVLAPAARQGVLR